MKKIFLTLITFYSFMSVQAQNVGIGTTTPNRAKLEVNGVAGSGATSAIFGGESTGISMQRNWPSIGFNQYRDLFTGYGKHIGSGYAAIQYLNPNSGFFYFDLLSNGAANTEVTTSINALQFSNLGNLGIKGAYPNSELQLPNTLNNRKLTLWESANNSYQYFGLGILSGAMIYNVAGPGDIHEFRFGASSTGSGILMQLGKDIGLKVYTQNIQLTRPVINGDKNLFISDRVPEPQGPLYSQISNSVAVGRDVFKGGASDNSVALGYSAGRLLGGTGTGPYKLENCVFIGNLTSQIYPSNYVNGTIRNSMALGYGSAVSENNQVRIGNGDVVSIGGSVGWSTLSDGRFKKDITENVAGLNFILKLKPVQYKYNLKALNNYLGVEQTADEFKNAPHDKDNIVYTGFVAQDVESIANQVGFNFSGIDKPSKPGGTYALRYADFVVPLVKAVQEQQQMIEKQQKLIDTLTKEIELIKNKMK